MAAGRGNVVQDDASGGDLYGVLGLKKECTDAELRLAYRRLAMIWHPDRCSGSGSSARVEEAKERFQEIQGAYAVLSDSNKRFLYDVGVYDSEDDEDDLSGMGDFLGEMADMMSQATPTESFEELQQLFVDMFQDDIMAGICGGSRRPGQRAQPQSPPCTSQPPQKPSRPPPARANPRAPPSCNGFGKRGSSAMGSGKPSRSGRAGSSPGLGLSGFCFKKIQLARDPKLRDVPRPGQVSETRPRPTAWAYDMSGGEGRSDRKQRVSTSRDVSDGFSRQSRASWQ